MENDREIQVLRDEIARVQLVIAELDDLGMRFGAQLLRDDIRRAKAADHAKNYDEIARIIDHFKKVY